MKPKIHMHLRQLPLRMVTGGFILSSGLDHVDVDEETAKQVHGMAAGAYPALSSIEPSTFAKLLAAGEVGLGAALLVPVVPPVLAGVGLVAFSGSLLGMYFRTPGLRRDNSIRPTPDGIALAKDSWMLGIGTTLILDELLTRAPRPIGTPA